MVTLRLHFIEHFTSLVIWCRAWQTFFYNSLTNNQLDDLLTRSLHTPQQAAHPNDRTIVVTRKCFSLLFNKYIFTAIQIHNKSFKKYKNTGKTVCIFTNFNIITNCVWILCFDENLYSFTKPWRTTEKKIVDILEKKFQL